MIEAIEFLQKHWAMVVGIGGAVWTYFWLTMDSKYTRKKDMLDHIKGVTQHIDKVEDRVAKNEDILSVVEAKIEGMPSLKDFSELQVLMAKIEGEAKSTNATIKAMSHQLGLLIEDKVLNRKE